ncbi:Asparagine synthase [Kalmanozyma brasiliensis GHG001]|uniref:Asparagine synthase n=1 Tax=Kalmanozyma brasiliensis (strain GHG001) TaxID=1365824 RepID=UPI0028682F56|nr:Asparagine synthase [Kalmanozyma brasiliensis GHG001]KAF6766839.1 Asparagine synthase [Kalmanozyma brasiliensis GHG001]
MCGIGVLITPASTQQDGHTVSEDGIKRLREAWPSVLENISNRGPDSLETIQHDFQVTTDDIASPWNLSLTASVLCLRGEGITTQPLVSEDDRLVLAWNGQIFHWDDQVTRSDQATSSKVRLDSGHNDAVILLDRIQHLLGQPDQDDGKTTCELALNLTLSEVEGPYAFVLLDRTESKLYYGRDPLGRRSLLLHRSSTESAIAIVSVASEALACLDHGLTTLTEIDCSSLWTLDLRTHPIVPAPLPRLPSRFTSPLLLRELRPSPSTTDPPDPLATSRIRADFLAVLSDSVRRRVTQITTSQPANSAHVAILFSGGLDCTTLALLADRHVPREQPIDLLNVAFENVRAIAAARADRERRRLVAGKAGRKAKGKHKNDVVEMDTEAMGEEEEKVVDIYAVPDRVTGLASYEELRALAPKRRWNFVSINIPYITYTAHRYTVAALMSPTSSVMDLSIGAALYFASRAFGHLCSSTPYTSPAKVLISGLGADEVLGGYSRHRAAANQSLQSLVDELQMDLDRLPTRNLGRDDRVLSDAGKEARYPFLDRTVLEFLTNIPVHQKVDLDRIGTDGAGGDKRLLRDVAKALGLEGASELKKRAMQFGTRAAKIDVESRHVKGHHKIT